MSRAIEQATAPVLKGQPFVARLVALSVLSVLLCHLLTTTMYCVMYLKTYSQLSCCSSSLNSLNCVLKLENN